MQQAEAAHAAGDTGGFDTFRELQEGNELGVPTTGKPTGRMRVGDADSDDEDSEADSGASEGEGTEALMKAALQDGDSEDEVDLYAALDSEDVEEAGGALANGVVFALLR
jgi:hypothetical protein